MEQKQHKRTAYDYERLEKWEAFYKEQARKLQEAIHNMEHTTVKLHLSDISDMVLPLLLVVHPWHQGRETWVAYWRAVMERYDISQKDAKGVSELTYENLQYLYTSLAGTIAERAETVFARVVYNPF